MKWKGRYKFYSDEPKLASSASSPPPPGKAKVFPDYVTPVAGKVKVKLLKFSINYSLA